MKLMKTEMRTITLVITLAVLASVAAAGQSAPPPPPPPPHDVMFVRGPGPGGGMAFGEFGEGGIVKGVPLSGDFIVSRDTTLADGNRIHSETQSKVYRDAEGRIRREVGLNLMTPATGNVKRSMVVITDPVAGKRYMLNPGSKTAREMPMHGPRHADANGGQHMNATMMGGPGEPGAVTKEQLGSKAVNGLQAEGVRVTRTIPAGAIGNEKPIEVVTERWYSPDLQIAVMTVHTDPMMGTVTSKLVNVVRSDPDASLFQVPSDYKLEVGRPNEPMYMPMKP
jgi:hypothetical protein